MGTNYFIVIPTSVCCRNDGKTTKVKKTTLTKSIDSDVDVNSNGSEDSKLPPFTIDYEYVDAKQIHLCKVSAGWPVLWDLQGIELAYNLLTGVNDNSNSKLEMLQKHDSDGSNQVCFVDIGFRTILDTIGDNEHVCFRTESHDVDDDDDMDWADVIQQIGENRFYGNIQSSVVSSKDRAFYAYTNCNGKKYWFFLDPNPIDRDWDRSW